MIEKIIIALILLFFATQQALTAAQNIPADQLSTEIKKHYAKEYNFSLDTTYSQFIEQIPVWEKVLASYKGNPDIHYLEIGVNQGRSAIWVLENILTHPTATLTGIDLFPQGTDFKEKYIYNLKLSGYENKTKTIIGFSQTELKTLPLNFYDIVYIDGDHRAAGVLADAVLSWDLLKPGGVLIFDDYGWLDKQLPQELCPRIAVDSFITIFRNSLEVVNRGYQLIIKKRYNFCESFALSTMGCSPIGQYIYVWNYWGKKNQLYHQQDMKTPIAITDKERSLIEQLIHSTTFGNDKLIVNSSILQDKDFIQLKKRLAIDFSNIEVENIKGIVTQ